MDYSKIKIKFIKLAEIKEKANSFRQKFWNEEIPIDIEKIIEIKLKIYVIPVLQLRAFCDTDAFITPNKNQLFVDHDMYMDERNRNRLRFSYAHEMGHYILHNELYESLNIDNYEDYYRFYDELSEEEYGKIETQANLFASYLLVPRDRLTVYKKEIERKFIKKEIVNIKNIEKEMLNSYLAIPLSKLFGISEEAMKNILNNEDKFSI